MSSNEESSVAPDPRLVAKLEELLAAKGSPEELDDAFYKEYFGAITEIEGYNTLETFAPHQTSAHLLGTTSLHKVEIPKKQRVFTAFGATACELHQAIGAIC